MPSGWACASTWTAPASPTPSRARLQPAEVTWKAGVDVLCFGGTKNGMAMGEAVVFFDRALSAEFDYRCKQAGQLASKMRFMAAQWVGMLETGAWLRHAGHANAMAQRLEPGLRDDRRRAASCSPCRPTPCSPRCRRRSRTRLQAARLGVLHVHRRPRRAVDVLVGHDGAGRRSVRRRPTRLPA